MLRKMLLLFVLAATTALPSQSSAQDSPSETDQLLDLLVAKNVITTSEASEFRATLKKRAAILPAAIDQPAAEPLAAKPSTGTQAAPRPAEPKDDAFNIRGYVQGRFTEAPGTTDTFEIRRARLIFDGKLTDATGYQVQLDGVKPQLLDARIDFTPVRSFGVTIGQFKIPFSTESYTSDNLLALVERSTVVNSFAPGRDNNSNGRDLGIQFSGRGLRFHGVDVLEYFAGVFNGAGINSKDDNHYKDTAARLVLRPVKQVALAGNYYNGATSVKEIGKERADLEINLTQGRFSAAAEYLWGHDGPIHRHGWYAQSGYRAGRRWEALFRFDKFNPRQHTATLTAVNNYVIGTNYLLNPYVKFQANYERQQDLITRRNANVVLLQTQVQFGGERARQ